MQRCEVLYEGRVQGVGFRMTTCRVARKFDVSGCVRNLPTGAVELIVEGETEPMEAFLQAVSQAMAPYITHQEQRILSATGEYRGFEVRY